MKVSRADGTRLRFDNLTSIDMGESLVQFQLHWDLTKGGTFWSIAPIALSEQGEALFH